MIIDSEGRDLVFVHLLSAILYWWQVFIYHRHSDANYRENI